jgi:hypothetical protein
VFTNQKMNAYLKKIADLCGINKPLTTYSARHTFATTITIANNMSIESVSKMLGHTSIKMTQRYSRIVDRLLKEDMGKIDGKYFRSFTLFALSFRVGSPIEIINELSDKQSFQKAVSELEAEIYRTA